MQGEAEEAEDQWRKWPMTSRCHWRKMAWILERLLRADTTVPLQCHLYVAYVHGVPALSGLMDSGHLAEICLLPSVR